MGTIAELYEAMLKLNLREKIPEIINETGPQIAEKIKQQLIKGERHTGDKISPQYKSAAYALKKYTLNSAPGYKTPDAKLTGKYYDGISVRILSPSEYQVFSTAPYAMGSSLTQYGDILKLSDKSREEYIEETFAPKLQQYITSVTGLTFE